MIDFDELNDMTLVETRTGVSDYGQRIIMLTYEDDAFKKWYQFSIDEEWQRGIYDFDQFASLIKTGDLKDSE